MMLYSHVAVQIFAIILSLDSHNEFGWKWKVGQKLKLA